MRRAWRLRLLRDAPAPSGAFAAAGLRLAGAGGLRAPVPRDSQPLGAAAAQLALWRAALRAAALCESGRAVWRCWRAASRRSAEGARAALSVARAFARSRLRQRAARAFGLLQRGAERGAFISGLRSLPLWRAAARALGTLARAARVDLRGQLLELEARSAQSQLARRAAFSRWGGDLRLASGRAAQRS